MKKPSYFRGAELSINGEVVNGSLNSLHEAYNKQYKNFYDLMKTKADASGKSDKFGKVLNFKAEIRKLYFENAELSEMDFANDYTKLKKKEILKQLRGYSKTTDTYSPEVLQNKYNDIKFKAAQIAFNQLLNKQLPSLKTDYLLQPRRSNIFNLIIKLKTEIKNFENLDESQLDILGAGMQKLIHYYRIPQQEIVLPNFAGFEKLNQIVSQYKDLEQGTEKILYYEELKLLKYHKDLIGVRIDNSKLNGIIDEFIKIGEELSDVTDVAVFTGLKTILHDLNSIYVNFNKAGFGQFYRHLNQKIAKLPSGQEKKKLAKISAKIFREYFTHDNEDELIAGEIENIFSSPNAEELIQTLCEYISLKYPEDLQVIIPWKNEFDAFEKKLDNIRINKPAIELGFKILDNIKIALQQNNLTLEERRELTSQVCATLKAGNEYFRTKDATHLSDMSKHSAELLNYKKITFKEIGKDLLILTGIVLFIGFVAAIFTMPLVGIGLLFAIAFTVITHQEIKIYNSRLQDLIHEFDQTITKVKPDSYDKEIIDACKKLANLENLSAKNLINILKQFDNLSGIDKSYDKDDIKNILIEQTTLACQNAEQAIKVSGLSSRYNSLAQKLVREINALPNNITNLLEQYYVGKLAAFISLNHSQNIETLDEIKSITKNLENVNANFKSSLYKYLDSRDDLTYLVEGELCKLYELLLTQLPAENLLKDLTKVFNKHKYLEVRLKINDALENMNKALANPNGAEKHLQAIESITKELQEKDTKAAGIITKLAEMVKKAIAKILGGEVIKPASLTDSTAIFRAKVESLKTSETPDSPIVPPDSP